MVLPKISQCGVPPAGWCAAHDPPRNAATVSNSRTFRTSIVANTYSAIAGSCPNTLHSAMPHGSDGRSIMSIPAVAACSSLSRGASGKSDRQICPTRISASASAGISRCVSVSSARTVGSSFSVILPRMRGATRAARDVDEERRGLHHPQPALIDQPFGLGAERGADRHRVALRQHVVELAEQIDALDPVARLARTAVGGEDAAAERGGAARRLPSDPAQADDAERTSTDLAVPRAAVHPTRRPGGAQAEVALDLAKTVAPEQHTHQHLVG